GRAGQRRGDPRVDHLRGGRGVEGAARGGHACHSGAARPGLAAVVCPAAGAPAAAAGVGGHRGLWGAGGGGPRADLRVPGPLDPGVAAAVLSLLGVLLLSGAFGATLLALRAPTPAASSSSWPASSRTSPARRTGDGDDRPD